MAFSTVFRYTFRPEVDSHIISGVVIDFVGMEVCVKLVILGQTVLGIFEGWFRVERTNANDRSVHHVRRHKRLAVGASPKNHFAANINNSMFQEIEPGLARLRVRRLDHFTIRHHWRWSTFSIVKSGNEYFLPKMRPSHHNVQPAGFLVGRSLSSYSIEVSRDKQRRKVPIVQKITQCSLRIQ